MPIGGEANSYVQLLPDRDEKEAGVEGLGAVASSRGRRQFQPGQVCCLVSRDNRVCQEPLG